jgi:hypothetical protein
MNEIPMLPAIESVNAMWHDLVIKHTPAHRAVDLKNQLIEDGLVQGQDFDFAYYQSKWDDMIGEIPTQTKFSFRDQAMATFYQLKWQ